MFEGCPPERPGRPRSCKAGGRRQRRSQMDDHRPPWGHRTRLTRVARPHLIQIFCGSALLTAQVIPTGEIFFIKNYNKTR